MFQTVINNVKYEVNFDYDRVLNETACTLTVTHEDNSVEIFTGFGEKLPEDTFNKAVGRYFALKHAISPKVFSKEVKKFVEMHRFPKDVRSTLWNEYFKRSSVKKLRQPRRR